MLHSIWGKWRSSFYYRLVVATMVVITVMVAAYSGVLYLRHAKAAELSQRERAEHLSSLLADALAQPLFDFNTIAVTSAVNTLSSHADIHSVRVIDSQGVVVIDTGSFAEHSEILLSTRRQITFSDGRRQVPVGSLELAFSRKPLQVELYRGFLELCVGGFLMAAGVVLAALAVFRTVTRPLREITSGLDELAAGNANVVLPKLLWKDEFGRMVVALGRFQDALVESQRAERSLRESEQRFKDYSNSSADWFWEINENLCFSYLSPNLKEILDDEQLIGHKCWEFSDLPELNSPHVWAAHRAVLSQHVPFRNFEFRVLDPQTRQMVWLSISGTPFFSSEDGRFLGYRGVGQNITARKIAEEGVRKLSLAVEQSPNMVIITNARGEIEYVNEALVRLTGFSQEELLGQNPRIFRSGSTPKSVYEDLWRTLSRGDSWHGEMTNRRKNGEEYVEYGIFFPLRQADGAITHYLSITEDVTEKKRVENELAHYRSSLENMVAERTAQLADAKEVAEAANRAKSVFVANMSHEIRTPLNAVLGLARIISRESHGRKSGETARRILEAGEHLLGVINDILDFSKIEAGKLHIENQDFNLIFSINDAKSLIAEQAHAKGLGLYTDLAENLPHWVRGDRLRFEQILINLLSNAVKFTQQGEIYLSARREGEFVLVMVKDTGIGMDEEQLGKLFRPFEQGDVSTTRKYGGTGLGLTISRDIARHMGGDITICSELGVGSEFTLRLPLEETTPSPLHVDIPSTIGTGAHLAGVRVLAAEDMELNRIVLEDLLVNEGASVVFAEHGKQAIELLNKHGAEAFDVVLTDIQMPIMDGYELARQLRVLAPNIPVLGLTARAMKEERDRCMAAGMVAQVTKPIDERELISAILSCTRKRSVALALPAKQAAVRVSSLINWAALAERYNGRPGFAEKVLDIFVRTHAETGEKLREAVQKADLQAIRYIAHSLRGVTGNIEAPELHTLAGHLETSVIKARPDITEVGLSLAQHIDELVLMLRERAERSSPPQTL
ncbi:PAS domain S-box protein [Uliginosibacterium gangwonense]|uniref:PAS domain S-box protein n=1 Tax=Uliginosibacterium gangwonense TaxID=392736 RepID=UPI0003A4EEE2|nr:PAS domain S-box protein [Uliginosibacterium gangwonense]